MSLKCSQAFKLWIDQCILPPMEAEIHCLLHQTGHGDAQGLDYKKLSDTRNLTRSPLRFVSTWPFYINELLSKVTTYVHLSDVYRASVLSKGQLSARDKKMNKTSLCHHFQTKPGHMFKTNKHSNDTMYSKFKLFLENCSSVALRACYKQFLCILPF